MVAMYIAMRLAIYPKKFKTSYVYFDKSVKAIFPAYFERCSNFEYEAI